MEIGNIIDKGAHAIVYEYQNYALKVYDSDYEKENVFYEAALSSVIEKTGLPIAKVYEVIRINNQLAIKMDYIKGKPMDYFISHDYDHINEYIKAMVNLQIKIHSKQVHLPYNMRDKIQKSIESNNILDKSIKTKILSLLNNFPLGEQLCHGDFHINNILKSKEGWYVIDWIDAANGNPDADVCRTYLLTALHRPDISDMYLNSYCEYSGKKRQEILKWLPVIAAARLSDQKVEEKDKLMSWIINI